MSLQITTETLQRAPNGQPNSRRTIGVGELISLRTARAADWTITEHPSQPNRRDVTATFERPGIKHIAAVSGRDRAELQIRVVAPSVQVTKVREEPLSHGTVGALMRLRFTLTPLSVSFAQLEFRERECLADRVWGYFDAHRSTYENVLCHDPDRESSRAGHPPTWHTVNGNNQVVELDAAGFCLRASDMNWPITAGGFRWLIPDEYRFGRTVTRCERPMVQAIRFDPAPRCTTAPFRGSVTVWKGGCEVRQEFV